jgi:gliding motility-associated-like protein
MKTYFFCLVFLILPFKSYSQLEAANWWFGIHAGISFLTNPPLSFGNMGGSGEGIACISDTAGNFLFYTNGVLVLDKLGNTMQNGFGLFGHVSSSQSAVIIPYPDNSRKYYVFTQDAVENFPTNHKGLNYSIVDMNYNSGLGAVIQKNIHLADSTAEKIAAIRHCNGRDTWIIVHKPISNKYLSYLITPLGITNIPIISIGTTQISVFQGYLKASPDGKKIASVLSGQEYFGCHVALFDFNNATGILSNPIIITNQYSLLTPYGAEFSPNNEYLFITYVHEGGSNTSALYQFDISSNNQLTINSSFFELFINNGHLWESNPQAIQLSINHKIYISPTLQDKIWVIHNPNAFGVSCNLDTTGISLTSGYCAGGFPNFLNSYFNKNPDFSFMQNCLQFNFSPFCDSSSLDSIRWNFGDIASGFSNTSTLFNPLHTFTDTASYTVRVYFYYPCRTDSVIKTVNVQLPAYSFPPAYIKDTITNICRELLFKPVCDSAALDSVHWNFGDTASGLFNTSNVYNPLHLFTDTGTYTVRLIIYAYCRSDTIYKTVTLDLPFKNSYLGADTTLCNQDSLELGLQIQSLIPAVYQWQNGSNSPTFIVTQAGSYSVNVVAGGCLFTDTINVDYQTTPMLALPNDTIICEDSRIDINIPAGNYNLLWNDGSSELTRSITQAGNYWLTASNLCGSATDTFELQTKNCNCYLYFPNAFTPTGDALNECFGAVYNCEFESYHLYIYNRWGQLLFETTQANECWDGKYKNEMVISGVYIWFVEYKSIYEDEMTGRKGRVAVIY